MIRIVHSSREHSRDFLVKFGPFDGGEALGYETDNRKIICQLLFGRKTRPAFVDMFVCSATDRGVFIAFEEIETSAINEVGVENQLSLFVHFVKVNKVGRDSVFANFFPFEEVEQEDESSSDEEQLEENAHSFLFVCFEKSNNYFCFCF